jgi:dipeptidyl aminopeptidase/acylaminoacyl peptidase
MARRVLARSLVLLFALPAPVANASPSLPLPPSSLPDIEAFLQIGSAGSPQLSPDGRVLYFGSTASGVMQVYRLDQTDRWPYQLTVFVEGTDFHTLSPDGNFLIIGVAQGGNENDQLWLVDASTGAAEALTRNPEARHTSPIWTPDSKSVIYASNEANGKDFYLYRLDLATRKAALLVSKDGLNTPGDVSDDGRKLLFTHYPTNVTSEVWEIALPRGRPARRTPAGEALYQAAQYDASGREVVLLSNANPDGLSRRAILDPRTGAIRFLETEGVWETVSLGLSPDRSIMGWTVNEDGYLRFKLRDVKQDRDLPTPPLDGEMAGFAFSRAGSRVAFAFSSATRTQDVWVWDWNAPSLEKWTHSTYAGIDPGRFVPPRLVRYRSFDGLEIPAFLYLPPQYRAGTPVPFVIYVHGGPEDQFRPGFVRHFQYLLQNGFGILAPNVRGSDGYGKAYLDLDNYTKRLDSVRDLKAGADWLVAEGYSAPGLLAVKGGSYGGYMTLAAITEYPDLFSAAVDEVGIANFVSFLENTAAYRRHLREAEYGPLTDRPFLESISPLRKADRIRTPLLVVHGVNDPRVPIGEARQIAAAVEANGGVVDTLVFADEGHGVAKRPNVLVFYRRMVDFLGKHLAPRS